MPTTQDPNTQPGSTRAAVLDAYRAANPKPSHPKLAEEFGVGKWTVRRWLIEADLWTPAPPRSPEKAEGQRRLAAGESASEVALALGVKPATAWVWERDAKLPKMNERVPVRKSPRAARGSRPKPEPLASFRARQEAVMAKRIAVIRKEVEAGADRHEVVRKTKIPPRLVRELMRSGTVPHDGRKPGRPKRPTAPASPQGAPRGHG